MAENNQSWYDRTSQNWDKNKGRFNLEEEDRNRGNYGSANYGSDYNQNQGMRGGYGGSYSSDYNNQQNSNRGGAYGSSSNRPGQARGSSSYTGQHHDDDWNRNRANMGSAGMYGGDFGVEDWDERTGIRGDHNRSGMGRNYGVSGSQQQNYGGSSEDRGRGVWDRTRDEVSSWFGDDDAERRRRMDEQQSGHHRGKGPKGYQRSPERVREDVCERLTDDDRLDASNIEVQLQGDEVILTGSVNTREDKRRAEDLVESISGVRNVENRLRVGSSSSSDTMNQDTYSTGRTTGSETTGNERSKIR